MTDDRIIYRRPDGGVSIVVPARPVEPERTEEALRARRDVPDDALDVAYCTAGDIPTDRTYRDAWERDTSRRSAVVKTNMPKARKIHMDKIRRLRDSELEKLDKDWMKALGQNDTAQADRVEGRRQILRDIPQTFDLSTAKTPDELKALWPDGLPR